MNMGIQAPCYTNNSVSQFCNNDFWAGGLCDSHLNFDQKHHQQQQLSEQHFRELYNLSQGIVQSNLHVHNSKPVNCLMLEKEIDQYIKSQNEELGHMLREHGKQEVRALLKMLECRSLHVLSKKDEEIAQAVKKKLDLEEYLIRLEAENRKWQKMAQENETMALSLYKTLEEMTEGGYFLNNGVVTSDAVSFCGETGGKEEIQEEATRENRVECCGEFEEIRMLCKSCHSRRSCFLFLPCRHLSCCKVCNSFLEACPVCRTPKKATIELRL